MKRAVLLADRASGPLLAAVYAINLLLLVAFLASLVLVTGAPGGRAGGGIANAAMSLTR